jgi:hypothetical protein
VLLLQLPQMLQMLRSALATTTTAAAAGMQLVTVCQSWRWHEQQQ